MVRLIFFKLLFFKLEKINIVLLYDLLLFILAVQHERQPRNSATLRPENLSSLDSERILREAVGVFGYDY